MVQHDSRGGGSGDLHSDNDFWRFSLAVYGEAEVAQECLSLQESLGVDVNLLLFCAWLGTRAVGLSHVNIEDAARTVAGWHEKVVQPLRGVRRELKTFSRDELAGLMASVKSAELLAEQVEQAMLFYFSQRIEGAHAAVDRGRAIAQNVAEYIDMKAGAGSEFSAPHLVKAADRFRS